jgi:hypothetical protein
MSFERVRARVLLAVLSVAALVLAACGPGDGPAEGADPELVTEESAPAEPEPQAPETDTTEDQVVEAEAEDEPEQLEVTAYVVGYHWGWALFDEDGSELEQLRVRKGATVELVAVNDHAGEAIAQLPEPVAGAVQTVDWHERALHAVEMGRVPDPEAEEGMSLSEAIDMAHDHGQDMAHHGLMVTGVGARAFLDSHAREPERLVFTVDREGTFEFRCTEECGFGHEYQRWEMLTVEA